MHLMVAFPFSGYTSDYDKFGMVGGEPTILGIGFICLLIIYIYLRFFKKQTLNKKNINKFGSVIFILLIIGCVLSVNLFPWDYLQKLNHIFATLIASLQFPFRILAIIVILATILGCIVSIQLEKTMYRKIIIGITLSTHILSSLFMLSSVLFERNYFKIYNP